MLRRAAAGSHVLRLAALSSIALLLLAACRGEQDLPAPPRATTVPEFEARSSTLVVPVALSLDDLQRVLERETPHALWSIDKPGQTCVAGQRVKVFGKRRKVTPDITCRIVGTVTRGAVSLSGSGERLTVALPIRATISARDVGGVLRGETATASATVRADVRPGLDRNWNPSVKVSISYDWKQPPGIDFLGQRIGFADRADARLAGVIAGLERKLQEAVARAQVRPVVARAWEAGLHQHPPEQQEPAGVDAGHADRDGPRRATRRSGRTLTLTVAVQALTETFVGDEPPAPKPTPLPPQIPPTGETGLSFFMPVMADYARARAGRAQGAAQAGGERHPDRRRGARQRRVRQGDDLRDDRQPAGGGDRGAGRAGRPAHRGEPRPVAGHGVADRGAGRARPTRKWCGCATSRSSAGPTRMSTNLLLRLGGERGPAHADRRAR